VVDYNLELIHHIEVNLENDSNNFGVSDVWGYTDQENNEYAIVGYKYGTKIFKVSNTENPVEVMDLIGPSSGDYYYHRDYKTYNNHLYIVNEMYGGDIGMQVVDLSPMPNSSPIKLNTYNYIAQSHNLWIDPLGFAFIEHQTGDNIHIANLANPSFPIEASSFYNYGANCHDIYTRDGYGYISEGYSNQFAIYNIQDINNISSPIATIPCEGYAHNAWLNDSGTHLVTTEETADKTIKIWDITDLNNITLDGEYLGENNLAHNVHVLNDLLYISHYTTGIKIVDIFNPKMPVEVAAYDTYPDNDDGGFYGCWGAFPYTQNGYVYASDMQHGLFVFNFDSVYAGYVNGYIFFNNDVPLANASIKAELNNKIYYTDDNGYFNFGFPQGEHQFLINNEDIITINFEPHQTLSTNISIGNQLIAGDINNDSIIDVLDIILVINFIMNTSEPTIEQEWSSDINDDSIINIQDIILIIQLILNFN
tara:strand:+ start:1353 stop:2789 length:1437 start_codon:yes stop_codon:yes gene_type:complete